MPPSHKPTVRTNQLTGQESECVCVCVLFIKEKGFTFLAFTNHSYRIWFANLKERDRLEYLRVHGKIILKWIFNRKRGVDWIDLAQDRDRWRALKSTIINIRVP
jgi:hypothetical protein